MIKIHSRENNIRLEDLMFFESKYGIELPANYKTFLLKFNGGFVDDVNRDFLYSFNSLKYGDTKLEDAVETYFLDENLLDKNYLPIANTFTDNPITIWLKSGDNYGKIIIFYFDRIEDPDLAANSLEELLGVDNIDDL